MLIPLKIHPPIDAGHDREDGDLVPGLRIGIVAQHRGVVAVEDIEDADGEAVLQRMGAALARGEIHLVAEVQTHIKRHLPVVRVGEVVERDYASGHVAGVLAGRHGFPMAALQREGDAEPFPLGAGVENIAAVVACGERVFLFVFVIVSVFFDTLSNTS